MLCNIVALKMRRHLGGGGYIVLVPTLHLYITFFSTQGSIPEFCRGYQYVISLMKRHYWGNLCDIVRHYWGSLLKGRHYWGRLCDFVDGKALLGSPL